MEIETELEGVEEETGQPARYYTHYCTSIDTACRTPRGHVHSVNHGEPDKQPNHRLLTVTGKQQPDSSSDQPEHKT